MASKMAKQFPCGKKITLHQFAVVVKTNKSSVFTLFFGC
jgi:hypothetical protein